MFNTFEGKVVNGGLLLLGFSLVGVFLVFVLVSCGSREQNFSTAFTSNGDKKEVFVFGFGENELQTKSVNRINAYINYLNTGHYDEAQEKYRPIGKANFDFLKNIKIKNTFSLPDDITQLPSLDEKVSKTIEKFKRDHKDQLEKIFIDGGQKKYDIFIFDRHTQSFRPELEVSSLKSVDLKKHLFQMGFNKQFNYIDNGVDKKGPAIWRGLINFFDLVLEILGKEGAYIVMDYGITFEIPGGYNGPESLYRDYGGFDPFNKNSIKILNDYPDNSDNRTGNGNFYRYIKYQPGMIQLP